MKGMLLIFLLVSSKVFANPDLISDIIDTTDYTYINKVGTNYYVSEYGNDTNNGLTAATPFQTLDKVRTLSLLAGDTVFFRRGSTFRGYYIASNSGNSANRIVYSCYGTSGNQPLISGAKNMKNKTDWILQFGNIWKSAKVLGASTSPSWYYNAKDIANIIFNNDAFCGVKKQALISCISQGDFYMGADDLLYLYSESNPGSYYTNIEVGGIYKENIFDISGKSYITVTNIDIKYSGNNSICISSSDNIIIQNCNISWTGGWYFSKNGTRMGNGVQIWETNSNIEIKNNSIIESYDAGISPQGNPAGYTQVNIFMHNNLIVNAYYSYELFLRSPNTFTNIKFENNTCIGAGRQWSQNQRPDTADAEHIRQAIATGKISGCTILNNIFFDGIVRYSQMSASSGMTCNHNLIYGVPVIGRFPFNGPNQLTIVAWRRVSNFDIKSIISPPLLNSDYTLQSTSPAIGAGIDVGYGGDLGAYPFVAKAKRSFAKKFSH